METDLSRLPGTAGGPEPWPSRVPALCPADLMTCCAGLCNSWRLPLLLLQLVLPVSPKGEKEGYGFGVGSLEPPGATPVCSQAHQKGTSLLPTDVSQ